MVGRAFSSAVLQACASFALALGLAASAAHDFRHCSDPVMYCARIVAGTLAETQASYLAKNSSHSGTPIFPAVAVVDEFVLVAGLVVIAGLFEVIALLAFAAALPFSVVCDLLQPGRKSAQARQKASDIFFSIMKLLDRPVITERTTSGLKSGANNTRSGLGCPAFCCWRK